MTTTAPPRELRGARLRVAPLVAAGTLIAGKYRVESIVGRGGTGVVLAAMHEALGQRVALKLLLPHAFDSKVVVRRALREARAAAALRSEHVTRVLDVGECDSGIPYIVMELLHGLDFEQVLTRRAALPL